jgi:uncharacterized DUF497 family protein
MIEYEYIVFRWHEKKDAINILKHGISFEVAHQAFFDEQSTTEKHQIVDGEQRWRTIGKIENKIIVFVGHLVFEDDLQREVIRIITARKATKQEEREYYGNRTNNL